jgi:hypothetical protein
MISFLIKSNEDLDLIIVSMLEFAFSVIIINSGIFILT